MDRPRLVSALVLLAVPAYTAFQNPGDLDPSFNPGRGVEGGSFSSYVGTAALQPDGRVLIGGSFESYNGVPRARLARVNPDGSIDRTFTGGTGPGGDYKEVSTIALQNDGRVVVGGAFTTFNDRPMNNVARLTASGALDRTFAIGTGATGKAARVYKIVLQPDGKIIVAGMFTQFNGVARNNIARLNGDGSLDTSFIPGEGADKGIAAAAIQSDGKIIIGGEFTSFNGTSMNRLARLNADGSLDATFNPSLADYRVVGLVAVQPDGKVLVSGRRQGSSIGFARLNPDGTLDPSFNPPALSDLVTAILLLPDGRMLMNGEFRTPSRAIRLARLNPDGSLDPSFNPPTLDRSVSAILPQPDGRVIIGGFFNSYNGMARGGIARIAR